MEQADPLSETARVMVKPGKIVNCIQIFSYIEFRQPIFIVSDQPVKQAGPISHNRNPGWPVR